MHLDWNTRERETGLIQNVQRYQVKSDEGIDEMGKKSNFAVKVIQLIFFAFVAKGFGFVREIVLANYYGTSYVSDVYVAVQNIPAIIFTIFGTAVTTGFIPLYT